VLWRGFSACGWKTAPSAPSACCRLPACVNTYQQVPSSD
jgi:hypothetical protein